MQAQKASDSPRRYKRGAGAGLKNRLRSLWPRVGTASPPKRNLSSRLNPQDTRWDVLGAIVPGILIAVGFGMLTLDWFPHNLFIGQLFFAIAGLLCVAKTIGHSIEHTGPDSISSRVVFAVLLCAVFIGVDGFFIWRIGEHKEQQERADVYAKLRFLLPQTTGADAINTAFKVINDSDREILAEPLLCGQSDSVIRFRNVVINGGSSYLDKRITKVEKGGDVQSTTCLHPITLAIGLPDYSVLCADIRVHLNYYLADDQLAMQTKVQRFHGAPTANGFNWEEIGVNAPESPCGTPGDQQSQAQQPDNSNHAKRVPPGAAIPHSAPNVSFKAYLQPGAAYPEGVPFAGIIWQKHYFDARFDIDNGGVSIQNLDFLVSLDTSIGGVGQLSQFPGITAFPANEMPAAWIPGTDNNGKSVTIPIEPIPGFIGLAPVYRVHCSDIFANTVVHLVIASVALNPTQNGVFPEGYTLWAPRRAPKTISVKGTYETVVKGKVESHPVEFSYRFMQP
jgi:hypothetical protein